MPSRPSKWQPTTIRLLKRKLGGNSFTLVVDTDKGEGYLKVLTHQGCPHELACELVGAELAQIIGLPTLEYSVVDLPVDAPIELANGGMFVPGPAFITRSVPGMPWDGSAGDLKRIVNPTDLARLVAFDTWTMNCDRFRPGVRGGPGEWRAERNILLASDGAPSGRYRLVPIDHACCFKCQSDLTPAHLRRVAGTMTLFGFFPEFGGLARREHALAAVNSVQSLTRSRIDGIIDLVPRAWLRDDAQRVALGDLIHQRIPLLKRIVMADFPAADLVDSQPE